VTEPYGSGFIRVNKHGEVDRIFQSDTFSSGWLLDDMAVDSVGNVYLAANSLCRIYRIKPDNVMTVFAGNGTCGDSGDNGPATEASLNIVETITIDGEDNIYAGTRHSIRKIGRSNGVITTLYDDATETENIDALFADKYGNLYFYNNNYRIKKISPSGVVSDFAGNGTRGHSGDGGPATSAQIDGVHGIVGDIWGNIYFDDAEQYIRKVDASGSISTIYNLPGFPDPSKSSRVSTDNDGMVYISQYNTFDTQIFKLRLSPNLAATSPTTGSVGAKVVLTGKYFGSNSQNGQVTFNGVSAPILFWSNETIVCTVPQGATNGNVVVTSPENQQSNGITFRPK
jgi:hypothetical protein